MGLKTKVMALSVSLQQCNDDCVALKSTFESMGDVAFSGVSGASSAAGAESSRSSGSGQANTGSFSSEIYKAGVKSLSASASSNTRELVKAIDQLRLAVTSPTKSASTSFRQQGL